MNNQEVKMEPQSVVAVDVNEVVVVEQSHLRSCVRIGGSNVWAVGLAIVLICGAIVLTLVFLFGAVPEVSRTWTCDCYGIAFPILVPRPTEKGDQYICCNSTPVSLNCTNAQFLRVKQLFSSDEIIFVSFLAASHVALYAFFLFHIRYASDRARCCANYAPLLHYSPHVVVYAQLWRTLFITYIAAMALSFIMFYASLIYFGLQFDTC